ncbi:hypothetical protein EDC01DRAFT_784470 [Geopyxis carbonaria]|nr:hypothetical protein EDC01DRAFT_784470 [Geopyxis carbonaria]
MPPADPADPADPRTHRTPHRTPHPAAAAPQPPTRVPAATISPLPALPLEVAEQVEWHHDALSGAEGRVQWWMRERGEEGRRVALVREVRDLWMREDRVWRMLGGVEGAERWRREAGRRRGGMEAALGVYADKDRKQQR